MPSRPWKRETVVVVSVCGKKPRKAPDNNQFAVLSRPGATRETEIYGASLVGWKIHADSHPSLAGVNMETKKMSWVRIT